MSPTNLTEERNPQPFYWPPRYEVVDSSPGIGGFGDTLRQESLQHVTYYHQVDPYSLITAPKYGVVVARAATSTNEEWLRTANEELKWVNEEADEEGLERPSNETFDYASSFIEVLSEISLPSPIVFPDKNRGISIQMIDRQFAFLLTCFGDGTGILNVNHDNYVLEGSYRDLPVENIRDSDFSRLVGCMVHPIAKHHASFVYSK